MILDEYGTGLDPLPDNETMRVPLVAVFPHPFHGRLVERVVLMVSHVFNYKGVRYRFTWKNSGVAYYVPLAEEKDPARPYPIGFQRRKGQMELPFTFD